MLLTRSIQHSCSGAMPEYSVYEIEDASTELNCQPGNSPVTNHIGTVEAPNLEAADERAVEEFGSPIAVE